MPEIDVIIAARNAAPTLDEALGSLRAQTFGGWRATVVDDGSTDETASVAARVGADDPRIRVIAGPGRGVSEARNAGLREATADWLLFFDADDWLEPEALDRLRAAAGREAGLAGAYGGYRRVLPDGTRLHAELPARDLDLFSLMARRAAFAIHACLVRREAIEGAGGFEPGLDTCEDWLLWQRIARTGARFAIVDDALALYRLRPDSASARDPARLLADALRVIELGHGRDPAVIEPDPAHVAGEPRAELPEARLEMAAWCAGLELGRDGDPGALLAAAGLERAPALDPTQVAGGLFWGVVAGACAAPEVWAARWPALRARLDPLLAELERHSGSALFASRCSRVLERLALAHGGRARDRAAGRALFVTIELTDPLAAVEAGPRDERLLAALELEGDPLGVVELPVVDRLVSAEVLADALSRRQAWRALGRLLGCTVYPTLDRRLANGALSLWREGTAVATGLEPALADDPIGLHDAAGWTVFLQELWGRPEWPDERFYDERPERGTPRQRVAAHARLEASEDLPDLVAGGPDLRVTLAIGGAPAGELAFADPGRLAAQALRARFTMALGPELVRVAVREGVLGRPLGDGTPLRFRLAESAAARAVAGTDWPQVAARAGAAERAGAVLATPVPYDLAAPAARRAMLPAGALGEVLAAARASGEPYLDTGAGGGAGVRAPELQWRPRAADPRPGPAGASQPVLPRTYGRHHFEHVFAERRDPWSYESPYERRKYELTLDLLRDEEIGTALEIGCAEGAFTARLAPRVGRLVAADISEVALARARERCAGADNVEFVRFDLVADELPAKFDLIVCSELLYYVGDRKALDAVAAKLAGALAADGLLVAAHANLMVDDEQGPGFAWDLPFGARTIGDALAGARGLRLVEEVRTPYYRVVRLRREAARLSKLRRRAPSVVELSDVPAPEPEVAAWFGGGRPGGRRSASGSAARLPILMYHRVAPGGAPETARYRVHPDAFREQMAYLEASSFRTIGLAELGRALQSRQPPPERSVVITFDDGYADFADHAWPVLREHGHRALVLLVAGAVGGTNRWDSAYGEDVQLLGWASARELQREGVEFGSHSLTHRPLTALGAEEVVREGAESRRLIVENLGTDPAAFAFPYGDVDGAVRNLVGGCGYSFGFTTRPGPASLDDELLDLPRVEVKGTDTLASFVRKLGSVS